MEKLREITFALSRIVLGMFILIAGLLILDLIIYISVTGDTANARIAASFNEGYRQGYNHNYNIGYQETYTQAYARGYDQGYKIGLESNSNGKEVSATRVKVKYPKYSELIEFLDQDDTDAQPYISESFVCFDFAARLNNNAEANGLRAAYVRIRFEQWGHAVVAFQTVDRGLVFIEPQSDKKVELAVGKPYPWEVSGAERTRGYDDPIIEIQILW